MEKFQTIKSKSELLDGVIAYYYFHELTEDNDEVDFYFFPHYRHGYTVYFDEEGKIIKAFYSQNYKQQIPVQLKGRTRKLGVAFEPLGINQFLDQSLVRLFNPLDFNFPLWNASMENLFSQLNWENLDESVAVLDCLFEQKIQLKPELHLIQKAFELLFEYSGAVTINEIAEQLGISRKTIQRLFQQHVCCSPETYKKVIKFRLAVDAAHQFQLKNLTELSLYSLYYDQADFNKRFRELTGQTPKVFFQTIRQMGTEDIFWKRY